jgi:L-rhamnose isomerase
VTGNYPGRARTPNELRADLEKVFSLVPGKHRLNLHAFYLETGGQKVDRDQIETKHFQRWIDWAKSLGIGMDFNPTCFAHPKAADGFTLAHRDKGIRDFWIEHAKRCRKIGADIGRALGSTCVTNVWIPDGYKDLPIDRVAPRQRLIESLDAIFAEKLPEKDEIDAVECKLFGIGSESYTAGSHEFYLGYAVSRQKAVCLDAGHFHPTETLADKISSVLLFVPRLLLHVSRGVRWDSDHVVILDDPTRAVMEELVRGDFLGRTSIGLDYFDASINRVAAWVIGIRATQKALLLALLEPSSQLREAETAGNLTTRLALLEEAKSLPWGAVWDEFCRRKDVPIGTAWLTDVLDYERKIAEHR